ncbi:MAG TPA: PKD domain-containing protein [bacterium]|nr:PKD domain-containing protein [bacterium]
MKPDTLRITAFTIMFYGYDNGKVTVPSDNSMAGIPNPPPIKNVADYYNYPFTDLYAFEDNMFKNNILSEGSIVPHINWTWLTNLAGKPVQLILRGRLDTTYFKNNNFFAAGNFSDQLIYDGLNRTYLDPETPDYFNANYTVFSGNVQQDPLFVDANNNDFHLQPGSPMIDAGGFLTIITSPSGSGNQITVEDAGYFYDGYGIEGEAGDIIQLKGQTTGTGIINIDYNTNTLTLNQSLTWTTGQEVSLAYSGTALDIGAYEYVLFPVAVIQNEPKEGRAPLTVSFDGSQSTSPNGDIVSYEWDFGDGSTSTGMKTSHIFTSPGEYTVTLTVTDVYGVKDESQTHIIVFQKEFAELPAGCYNNVFNPAKGERALIVVELPKQAYVRLNLYNTRGNRIRELADEQKEAGIHKYYWDGRNDSGDVVGSGLYFVHIQAGDYKKTKKIVVVK